MWLGSTPSSGCSGQKCRVCIGSCGPVGRNRVPRTWPWTGDRTASTRRSWRTNRRGRTAGTGGRTTTTVAASMSRSTSRANHGNRRTWDSAGPSLASQSSCGCQSSGANFRASCSRPSHRCARTADRARPSNAAPPCRS